MPHHAGRHLRAVDIPTSNQYDLDQKKGARADDTAGRQTTTGRNPVEAPTTIQPDAYAEALEQTDAGLRLALPQFAESVGIGTPAPDSAEVDAEVANEMATDFMDARAKLVHAGGRISLDGNRALHRRINDLINEVDRLGAMLAERHSS